MADGAGGFFTCVTPFGVVYRFGAFFKPIAAEVGADRVDTSAVFSIAVCIYNLFGLAGGHLADRFGLRPVLLVGVFAMSLIIATSMAGGCVRALLTMLERTFRAASAERSAQRLRYLLG